MLRVLPPTASLCSGGKCGRGLVPRLSDAKVPPTFTYAARAFLLHKGRSRSPRAIGATLNRTDWLR